VEQGAFTADEARKLFASARAHGLQPRLHVDQLTAGGGGAELAAELGAACADHLEEISDAGIRALAEAGVTAVLVPVSTLFLRQSRYAPGRKLRDAGVNVALATNVNPGSAMTENVGLTLSLGCLQNGLTASEAFIGVTRAAAEALRLSDAGRLTVGGPADLVVWSCGSYRHLPYHLGVNHVSAVVKAGVIVHEPPSFPVCVS
jgi:imidazolonepropionase